jgi:hypothetical protein
MSRKQPHSFFKRITTLLSVLMAAMALPGCGSSTEFNPPSSPPAVDGGVQDNCPSPGHCVELNWNASSNGTGYKVYYGTTQGGPYPNQFTLGNSTQYMVWNLTPNTYYFVVTATNQSGESGYSNEAKAIVTGKLPAIAQAVFE